jgi:hypothetical protein
MVIQAKAITAKDAIDCYILLTYKLDGYRTQRYPMKYELNDETINHQFQDTTGRMCDFCVESKRDYIEIYSFITEIIVLMYMEEITKCFTILNQVFNLPWRKEAVKEQFMDNFYESEMDKQYLETYITFAIDNSIVELVLG